MLRKQHSNSTTERGLRRFPALVALVAGSLLSTSASAANHVRSHCQGTDDLRSTEESPVLTVNVVDLGDRLGEPKQDDNLDLLSAHPDDSLAPLLYLGPRVASILENVFDDDSDDGAFSDRPVSDSSVEKLLDQAARANKPSSMAPIAERRDDAAIEVSDRAMLEVEPAYLKIHRQMYRTDI